MHEKAPLEAGGGRGGAAIAHARTDKEGLMKRALLYFAFAALVVLACSSKSGSVSSTGAAPPAPTISNLSIPSPIKPGVAASGQVEVADSDGLAGLSLNFTVTGADGLKTMFSSAVPIEGGSTGTTLTESAITFMFALATTTPAGTYQVTVTVGDEGATSNALQATVTVE
jgi:hypothetical protein